MKRNTAVMTIAAFALCALLICGCGKKEEPANGILLSTPAQTPTLAPVLPADTLIPQVSNTPEVFQTPEPTVTNPPPTDTPLTSKPTVVATGFTMGNNVNIRSGPGTDFDVVEKVDEGTKVEITKKNYTNDWHQIWYDGQLAYISTDFVQFGEKPETLYEGVVTSNTLNVRAAASTSSSVLGSLKNGDKVQLVSQTAADGWYQIWYSDTFAYVSAEYISVDGVPSVDGGTAAVPDGTVAGTVTATKAALRSQPTTEGNTPVGEVVKGDVVAIYFKTGDFYCVSKLDSSNKYYVYASYVSPTGTVPSGTPMP